MLVLGLLRLNSMAAWYLNLVPALPNNFTTTSPQYPDAEQPYFCLLKCTGGWPSPTCSDLYSCMPDCLIAACLILSSCGYLMVNTSLALLTLYSSTMDDRGSFVVETNAFNGWMKFEPTSERFVYHGLQTFNSTYMLVSHITSRAIEDWTELHVEYPNRHDLSIFFNPPLQLLLDVFSIVGVNKSVVKPFP